MVDAERWVGCVKMHGKIARPGKNIFYLENIWKNILQNLYQPCKRNEKETRGIVGYGGMSFYTMTLYGVGCMAEIRNLPGPRTAQLDVVKVVISGGCM